MNTSRLLLVAAGMSAFIIALAVPIPDAPLSALVTAVGSDYLLVAVIALVALVIAVGRLHQSRGSTIEQATMPEPEWPVSVKPFGAKFDAALADYRLLVPVVGDEARQQLHTELRALAARTICRVGHCDHGTAFDYLERGDWTDNGEAAAFLRTEEPPTPALSSEIASVLQGKPWFRTQAVNAAEAIVEAEIEADASLASGREERLTAGGSAR